jgi:hypothetical protein
MVTDVGNRLQVHTTSHHNELNISNSAFRTSDLARSTRLTCKIQTEHFSLRIVQIEFSLETQRQRIMP